VDVAAWVLALTTVPLLPLHYTWNHYVSRDLTVVPAILWLGAPALLAVLVGWPYREVSPRVRGAIWVALLGLVVPFFNLAIGVVR